MTRTAPSSVEPEASAVLAPPQRKGTRTTSSIGGAKWGWHWSVGGLIRLDGLEPSRASRLQTRTGIDSSYLMVEYRTNEIGEQQEGLDFNSTALGIGLRLEY